MARTTKTMSGAGQKKFFRDLFRADGGVAEAAIQRLADRCEAEIAQIRVRRTALPVEPISDHRDSNLSQTIASPEPVSAAPAGGDGPFDPFAFSVVALLAKQGRPALSARLAEISAADQLIAIADAQHLGRDPATTGIEALREAIVAGAERRIAERRAAAS